MNKRKIAISAVIFGVAALVASSIIFGWFAREEPPEEESQHFYSQLTGLEIGRELSKRPILSVIFDNHPLSRPQTGLDSAGIVFEVVTEGGITRCLAFYQEKMPDEIGPIRSLRSHFLDWAMGFDASIAHAGGSSIALEAAEQRNAKSLSQFKYSEPYFRTEDKPAPHNMYARTQDILSLQNDLGHGRSQFNEFLRKSDDPGDEPQATSITIDYSTPTYQVEFRYQVSTNTYIRYLAGNPHVDSATNQPISVKNLVVIRASAQDGTVNAIGGGEALIFQDGNVQTAHWQKTSHNERIVLTDDENGQITLNRGDTWFAILPPDRPVDY